LSFHFFLIIIEFEKGLFSIFRINKILFNIKKVVVCDFSHCNNPVKIVFRVEIKLLCNLKTKVSRINKRI
jgi:hypothetical protein